MQVIKSVSLFYTEGNSDKVYHAQLCETSEGFVVNFQFGRRGSTLQTGTKTAEPVTKEKAESILIKLMKEKEGKGYTREESGQVFSSKEFQSKKSEIVAQLLNAIEEDEVAALISDESFVAQEKYNGERRFIVVSNGAVTGVNRKGLNVPVSDALAKFFMSDLTVDGELIGDNYFAFDILSLNGQDLKSKPFQERQKILSQQKFGSGVTIVKTARTTAEKRNLINKVTAENGEGLVFKNKTAPYTGGRPSSGGNCLKYKFYKTATFIVSNLTKNKRSVGLVVLDGEKEVEVGKVTILPNFPVPTVGSLVEVQYLYAYKGGAVYQPVYLGERTDLDKSDAIISQLVYKNELE